MADHHSSGGRHRHLNASGPREVVYCHACEAEWYQDEHEHSLICPECESEITEIITLESDPRPVRQDEIPPPDFHSLHGHNPWDTVGNDSDPEEADIEEHITRGPGGSMFFSRTIRSGPRGTSGDGSSQRRAPPNDTDAVMANFQNMVGSLMGPDFRPGQAGRSGPDTLFNDHPYRSGFQSFGSANGGPSMIGGRFTFSNIRPRNTDGPQPGGPPVDDLATYDSPTPQPPPPNGHSLLVVSIRAPPDEAPRIIGSIFGPGPMGGAGGEDHTGPGNPAHGGMPPGLQALFAAMLNPANARSGDAVYSQEALDQIISTLMEQHPTSNAPGPASPDAIASLPKKKLDEKMLGPEGKGECSVCMDDVHTGDEVVSLPCSHWFHETCAGAWLSEHNTCPICRKGIDSEPSGPGAASSSSARENSNSNPSNSHRSRRLSAIRSPPRLNRTNTGTGRNEARLDAIRNIGNRATPTEEEPPRTRRWQVVGETTSNDPSSSMPGSYSSSRRFREDDRDQRDYRDRRDRESRSENPRISRRSSQQSNVSSRGEGGSGPMSWLRDRFGSNSRHHDN
ncbi:hypothetical protein BGZ60DRAFT_532463 [Tricladium varicosporioides]|nr:hypothetical protein BGZ60DRAFT_532463 [Hymenoscyphus varicosporioides]